MSELKKAIKCIIATSKTEYSVLCEKEWSDRARLTQEKQEKQNREEAYRKSLSFFKRLKYDWQNPKHEVRQHDDKVLADRIFNSDYSNGIKRSNLYYQQSTLEKRNTFFKDYLLLVDKEISRNQTHIELSNQEYINLLKNK